MTETFAEKKINPDSTKSRSIRIEKSGVDENLAPVTNDHETKPSKTTENHSHLIPVVKQPPSQKGIPGAESSEMSESLSSKHPSRADLESNPKDSKTQSQIINSAQLQTFTEDESSKRDFEKKL